jgi:branched-chain amino acid transport system permease protein
VDDLPIILVRGLGLGAIYALLGMSMNAIYRSSGILNFAQGSMFVLGGIVAVQCFPNMPDSRLWLLMLPVAALALAALLAIQGYITLLPLRSSVEQHSWLVTTLAAAVVIGAIILLFQGTTQLVTRSPFPSMQVMGTRTPAPYVLAIALALFWCVALRLFFSKTLTGLSISAVAQDLDAARAAGLRVRRLQILSFAISGLIVGSAGFVAAPVVAIANDSGVAYSTSGFVAAVVGGMGNDTGALIGGALVGVASMYAAYAYGGEFQNLVTLGLLVLVLMVRPEGLFGAPLARRV